MRNRFCLILLFLLSIISLNAQESFTLDDHLLEIENKFSVKILYNQINEAGSLPEKAKACFYLSEHFSNSYEVYNMDSSLFYANMGLELSNGAEKSQDEEMMEAYLLNYSGLVFIQGGPSTNDSIAVLLKEMIKEARAIKSPEVLATIYNLIGIIQENRDSAFHYYNEGIKEAENSQSHKLLGYLYSNLSFRTKNSKDKRHYQQKSAQHFALAGNMGAVAYNLATIGIVDVKASNLDSAEFYFHLAENILIKLGFDVQLAIIKRKIGWAYSGQDMYSESLEHLHEANNLLTGKNIERERGYALNGLGKSYYMMAYYPDALKFWLESLYIQRALKDSNNIRWVTNRLAYLYIYMHEYRKAETYFVKDLELSRALKSKSAISAAFSGYCYLYSRSGDIDKLKKSIDSLNVYTSTKENTYGFVSNLYFLQKDHAPSIAYADSVFRRANDGSPKAEANYRLAKALLHYAQDPGYDERVIFNGKEFNRELAIDAAIERFTSAKRYFEEIEAYIDERADIALKLSKCYRFKGDFNKAYSLGEEHRILQDSVFGLNAERQKQALELKQNRLKDSLQASEEKALLEKAHQEEMRQEEKTRNWSIAGGVFALLLAGGFYSRWRYVRNSKAIIEKEKDRSDNLLLNILPEEIAQELKQTGKASARDFDQVSILFTDFADFTETAEKLSASELVEEINHCFEAFDHILEKYGIEKIKTIGDAYMAAGGLPVPGADSVKNTVLAALEMQDFIEARSQELRAKGQPHFQMRVGIHTGPVVAGIVGVKKFQYDVWGDTVNTASRVESAGEVGKVNISNDTYELLKDDERFAFESRGKVNVKGKGEMEMLFVSHK